MSDRIEVGQHVFYYDVKDDQIRQGDVTGLNIGENGYLLITILNQKDKQTTVESAHVFIDKENAMKHRNIVKPFIDEANKAKDLLVSKMDQTRIMVIGEPNSLFKRIVDRLRNPLKR